MKVQGSPASSNYYDTESHLMVYHVGDVVEMTVKEGVASISTPLLMIGYRPPDIPGLIVEDRLPPRPELVSAKYEATMKLNLKQGEMLWPSVWCVC